MSYESADLMLQDALSTILRQGKNSAPRGNATREVLSWSGTLTDPRARLVRNPVRDLRVGYAAAKIAWDLSELDDPTPLLFWNPSGSWYIDEVPSFVGNNRQVRQIFWGESYGKRMMPYLREQLNLMRKDRETRRAWVPIWMPEDVIRHEYADDGGYHNPSIHFKNIPCCLGFQLRVIHSKLEMQVIMRSQSVGVLPYDVFLFSVLHELISNELQLELGALHWHCNSIHVYEREVPQRQAELDWYEANRFKIGGAFDFDVQRLLTKKMPDIRWGFETAQKRWETAERQIRTNGVHAYRPGHDLDPIEQLLVDGVPRNSSVIK